MKYLIQTEFGSMHWASTLTEYDINAANDGLIDILNIENKSIYVGDGKWEYISEWSN